MVFCYTKHAISFAPEGLQCGLSGYATAGGELRLRDVGAMIGPRGSGSYLHLSSPILLLQPSSHSSIYQQRHRLSTNLYHLQQSLQDVCH
jgi:hypothetical protein